MAATACSAANQGAAWKIEALLAEGVNPDAADNRGRTPLLFAAAGGHTECMQLLLNAGADPMHFAFVGGAPLTALEVAAKYGKVDAIRLLLDAGVPINGTWIKGRMAVTLAVRFGRLEVLEFLLQRGADPNQRQLNVWGLRVIYPTPLQWAVTYKQEAMVRALVAAGADPRAHLICRRGVVTPLGIATRRQQTGILGILTQRAPVRRGA
jgi:ankyrin repeat protein